MIHYPVTFLPKLTISYRKNNNSIVYYKLLLIALPPGSPEASDIELTLSRIDDTTVLKF
jgi:hypothetical protein